MKRCLPAYLLFAGALMALPIVWPVLGFMQWFLPIPALLFFFSEGPDVPHPLRAAYGRGFLFFVGYYLIIWHWFIYLYPMDFMGVTKGEALLLVAICWFGMTLLQGALSALILPLFSLLRGTRPVRRLPWLTPLLFAAQWTVNEWSQTLCWTGVPWARTSLGQVEYGIVRGSAALLGSYFITFAVLAVAGLLAFAILHAEKRRFLSFLAAGIFALQLALGTTGYLLAQPKEGQTLTVAAVQGNVGSDLKWTSDSREKSFEIYDRYTAAAAAAGADAVLFPETFIPAALTEDSSLGLFIKGLAAKYDITVFCGAFKWGTEQDQNAVFMVTPDGKISETAYAKRKLVPFGEYVPWRPVIELLLPALLDLGMLSEDLAPGTGSALFDTVWGDIGSMICFDSIYEALALESVRDGAALLLLPTNDSWFTDSAGVYMHYAQARLRAVETGRWIVRAADTGISGLIAPNGASFEELPPLVDGMALGTVYLKESRTLYSYIGNTFVYLLITAILALPALSAYPDKRKK